MAEQKTKQERPEGIRDLSALTGMKVVIGQSLWEHGGWADARLKRFIHHIRRSLADPNLAAVRAIGITNVNPRGLCHIVLPYDLETVNPETDAAFFVTPCGGTVEGAHWVKQGWQAAIIPTHARNIAAHVDAYMNATTEAERAAARSKFDNAMLDINLYPNALGLKDQNPVRLAAGLKPLDEPTAEGSRDWAASVSDTSNTALMLALREQVSGLKNISAIIGVEGSQQRQEYVSWYGENLQKIITNKSATGDVITAAQSRDLARILCATLNKGNVTITPRKQPEGEVCFLMELDGFARIYEEALPKDSTQIATTPQHKFTSNDGTMVKVLARQITPFTLELHSVRPLASKLIGDGPSAARDPEIQEITDRPYKHGDLQRITFNGSEVAKRLRMPGFLLPASWTDMGAKLLRNDTDALPNTAMLAVKARAPK